MDCSLPIFQRSARVRASGSFLNVVNHVVVTIEGRLEGFDNRKTLTYSDHLLQSRFYLALQQVNFLRRNVLQLGLKLIIEPGNTIDLP
jgi:hypothetical protein